VCGRHQASLAPVSDSLSGRFCWLTLVPQAVGSAHSEQGRRVGKVILAKCVFHDTAFFDARFLQSALLVVGHGHTGKQALVTEANPDVLTDVSPGEGETSLQLNAQHG
jgi:hypothetical protein